MRVGVAVMMRLQVAAISSLVRVVSTEKPCGVHGLTIGFEFLLAGSPDDDVPTVDDRQQGFDLHSALHTGAEDADALDVARCEVSGDHRAGGGSADVGEMALIEEDALELGGLLAEHEHQTVGLGQTELDVVVETRRHLDDEDVIVLDIAVLDVDVARRVVKYQLAHRRHHHVTVGVGDESLFDGRCDIDA